MLVHQAAAQLELWTGLPAPVDVMWQAAVAAAGRRLL
jgi:shikimate 5-dehydrogenase